MRVKKKLVVFTGAGMSAESGIKTFRDTNGLWEEYNVEEVATPEAWKRNPELVLEFYNKRRKQILNAKPNEGHFALKALERIFDVQIITQNIDNLHERAGSKNVLHLHGEITKARSSINSKLLYPVKGEEIKKGECCELGSQLRPHIVWFGELVPEMENACTIASAADVFVIVGTSLNVYPAAGLVHYTPRQIKKFLIDPNETNSAGINNIITIKEKASTGLRMLAELLEKEFSG